MKYLLVCFLCCGFNIASGQQFAFQSDCATPEGIYNNYYNRIKLVVEGLSCSDVLLRGDSFDVKKIDDCIYYIRAISKQHTIAPIEIFDKKNNKPIAVVYIEFSDSIPLPEVNVNKPWTSKGRKSISPMSDSVYCTSPIRDQFNDLLKFSVLSYNVEVVSRNKVIYSEKVMGYKISSGTKKYMNELRYGDKVVLKSIKAKDQNGNDYLIPSKTFDIGN